MFPSKPAASGSSSHRIRQRCKQRRNLWRTVSSLVEAVNAMAAGGVHGRQHQTSNGQDSNFSISEARVQAERHLWQLGMAAAKERRGFDRTGAQAVSALCKVQVDSYGHMTKNAHNQVPLLADAIAEPQDNHYLDMLSALPPTEAQFYSKEANVVSWCGKSKVLLKDLEQ